MSSKHETAVRVCQRLPVGASAIGKSMTLRTSLSAGSSPAAPTIFCRRRPTGEDASFLNLKSRFESARWYHGPVVQLDRARASEARNHGSNPCGTTTTFHLTWISTML